MKAFPGVLALTGALLFAPQAFAADEGGAGDAKSAKGATAAEAAKQQAPAGPVAPRMIVVRDPDTGRLRPATAEERRALLQGARRSLAATVPQTWVEEFADGRKVAHLGPEFFQWSVVRKRPDGTLVFECVPGGRVPEVLSSAPAPAAVEK